MSGVDKLKNISAVVFDIGGTLLDFDRQASSTELKVGADLAHAYLKSVGANAPPAKTYRRRLLMRLARAYVWSRMTGGELNPMPELDGLHASMDITLAPDQTEELARLLYSPSKSLARAHPETVDTLRRLRDGEMKIALVSNTIAPPCGIEDHLDQEGLLEYFPIRVYSCVVGVPKPNPKIFRAVLDQLDVAPDRSLYVGDKPHIDVVGSRRAGMRSALRAVHMPTKKRFRPDIHVREIKDLLDHLELRAD